MVPEPLTSVTLHASSMADDLGFVALGDVARVLGPGATVPYRIIGGQMVTALAARWGLGAALYRVTLDVDLGAPPKVVVERDLASRFSELGYTRVSGDRFTRQVHEGAIGSDRSEGNAVVDVLLPAYTRRPASNRQAGDIVATEALGLAGALQRPPVVLELRLRRIGGQMLEAELCFPDEPSALVLKAFAARTRRKPTDYADVWRCLEIAYAARVQPSDFAASPEMSEGLSFVRTLFKERDGEAMSSLAQSQRLSREAADQLHTRIRALIAAVASD